MGGLKGRSGRKKSPTRQLKDALDYVISKLPELVYVYTDVCLDGKHAELFQYLYNRAAGIPRATTDVNLKGGEGIGVGMMKEIYQRQIEYQRALQEGNTGLLLNEGTDEAPDKGTE